jgi:DNA-binding CsgD family transcriptional regulator
MKDHPETGRICTQTVEQLVRAGKTDQEAADLMGCHWATIRRLRNRLGIFRHTNNVAKFRLTREEVLPLWVAGASLQEIADTLGCTAKTVRSNTARLDLPAREYRSNKWWLVAETTAPEPRPAPAKPGITGRLIASKGKWAALAEIADEQGLTMRQVQQRYHQAVRG